MLNVKRSDGKNLIDNIGFAISDRPFLEKKVKQGDSHKK
jgi:hypothetical protein